MLLLVGQRVLANPVHLQWLVGRGRKKRCFGQQLDLQRHQVSEDARQSNHHVHPWSTQFRQRNERGPGNAAVAVKARQCAHQGQGLAYWCALVFQVVAAPQHHGNRLGQRVAVRSVALQQQLRLGCAFAHCQGAGDAERVKTVDIASGGEHCGRAQNVSAWGRSDVAAVERMHQRADLGIHGQLGVDANQLLKYGHGLRILGQTRAGPGTLGRLASDQGFYGVALQRHTVGGVGHGKQHIHALGRAGRATGNVQAVRDEGVFQF